MPDKQPYEDGVVIPARDYSLRFPGPPEVSVAWDVVSRVAFWVVILAAGLAVFLGLMTLSLTVLMEGDGSPFSVALSMTLGLAAVIVPAAGLGVALASS